MTHVRLSDKLVTWILMHQMLNLRNALIPCDDQTLSWHSQVPKQLRLFRDTWQSHRFEWVDQYLFLYHS